MASNKNDMAKTEDILGMTFATSFDRSKHTSKHQPKGSLEVHDRIFINESYQLPNDQKLLSKLGSTQVDGQTVSSYVDRRHVKY